MPARILTFMLPVLLTACQPYASNRQHSPDHIDSLTTDEQVLDFVHGLDKKFDSDSGLTFRLPVGKDSTRFAFWNKYRQRLDSFGISPYEKIDLDGNGLTDLVFNGFDSVHSRGGLALVILFFAKDSTSVFELPVIEHPHFFACKTIRIDGQPFLQTLTETRVGVLRATQRDRQQFSIDGRTFQRWCDTLDWTLGYPIERWPHDLQMMDTLRYVFGGGFGDFDFFQMTIANDSIHLLRAAEPNTGTFEYGPTIFVGKLDSFDRQRLHLLLARIDWQRVDSSYDTPNTDESMGYLEVWYDKSKRTVVSDYGCRGTLGLFSLESLLFDFYKTGSWTPVSPDQPAYPYEKNLAEFSPN